jgi:hypothetical protein
VKYTYDGTYLVSGSDDTNLRLWKSKASEQLGVVSFLMPFSVFQLLLCACCLLLLRVMPNLGASFFGQVHMISGFSLWMLYDLAVLLLPTLYAPNLLPGL